VGGVAAMRATAISWLIALGPTDGAVGSVVAYDSDLLARARIYEHVPVEGALWSLNRAAGDWNEAVRLALQKGVVLVHPERGEQTVLDVSRNNAHDAHHHEWDIRRSLQ
jgi:hypothetical protein